MDTTIKEIWFRLSLPEQMVNIGNEVKRAFRFDGNVEKQKPFIEKAIQYNELSISDPKNLSCKKELEIGSMILQDYIGNHTLDCTKEQIRNYYLSFTNLL